MTEGAYSRGWMGREVEKEGAGRKGIEEREGTKGVLSM